MPIVKMGDGSNGAGRDSKKLQVTFQRVAPDLIDASDNYPTSLGLLFQGTQGEGEFVYSIPLTGAGTRLKPLVSKTSQVPDGEAALRGFLDSAVRREPLWASTWGRYIQDFLAPPGKHKGWVKDIRLKQGSGDGTKRYWFTVETEDGLTSDFPAPHPNMVMRFGINKENQSDPALDEIGPPDEFNNGKGPFIYATQFGLDWDLWEQEITSAVALWPGHYDSEGMPIEPFFQSIDDIAPDLLDAIARHTFTVGKEHIGNPVRYTTHIHDKYGLGIKRGQFFFEFTPIEVEARDPMEEDFAKERERFLESWNNLAHVVLEGDFTRGGSLTDDGRTLVREIVVPVVYEYPKVVKLAKEDGSPRILVPPTYEGWTLDGMIHLCDVAEKLLAANAAGDIGIVGGVTQPLALGDADKSQLLAWVVENVPDIAGEMDVDAPREEEF